MEHEVLYDQAAKVSGRICEGNSEHVPEELAFAENQPIVLVEEATPSASSRPGSGRLFAVSSLIVSGKKGCPKSDLTTKEQPSA